MRKRNELGFVAVPKQSRRYLPSEAILGQIYKANAKFILKVKYPKYPCLSNPHLEAKHPSLPKLIFLEFYFYMMLIHGLELLVVSY